MSSEQTTSTSTIMSTPAGSKIKTTLKSSKPALKIVLRLSPGLLARFPSAQPARKASRSKPPSTPTVDTPNVSSPMDNEADASNTHSASNEDTAPVPAEGAPKRKGIPGPKPGTKRNAAAIDPNAPPKPRGKPGPKKKPRLDGESPAGKGAFGGVAPVSHHKLGPKANQGAINAGLRALDRTGKPCRKWNRKGFQFKSFTGVVWSVSSWSSPKSMELSGDSKSETPGSSDVKPEHMSSAVASENSNHGADNTAIAPHPEAASSPVDVSVTPVGAVPA